MNTTQDEAMRLAPCPFCGAPGFAMLVGYGFKIKCTNTACTVETPIRTHRHQVETIWNRAAPQESPAPAPVQADERQAFEAWAIANHHAYKIDSGRLVFVDEEDGVGLWTGWQGARAAPPPYTADAQPVALAFTAPEAQSLLEMFGGECGSVTVRRLHEGEGPQVSGEPSAPAGLYGHMTDYPEEGCMYLGPADEEEKPAHPAPAAQGDALDAARWRYVRLRTNGEGGFDMESEPDPYWGPRFAVGADAAIDAAMLEAAPPAKEAP